MASQDLRLRGFGQPVHLILSLRMNPIGGIKTFLRMKVEIKLLFILTSFRKLRRF